MTDWKELYDKISSFENAPIPQGYIGIEDLANHLTNKLYGTESNAQSRLWNNPSNYHVSKALALAKEMERAGLKVPTVKVSSIGLISFKLTYPFLSSTFEIELYQCGIDDNTFYWYYAKKNSERNVYFKGFTESRIVNCLKSIIDKLAPTQN